MKLNQILCRSLALGFIFAASKGAAAPLDEGLVAYYRFNGDTADSSGNARQLIATDTLLVAERFGRPASACKFNGSSSLLAAGQNEPTLNLNLAFTISCWVKIANFNPEGSTLVRKDGDVGFNVLNFGSPNRLSIEAFKNGRQYRGFAGTPPVGRWCMLSATWDGNSFAVYIDGQNQAVSQDDIARTLPIYPITIGSSLPWPDQGLDGVIDEVRIYNRALPAADVASLFGLETPSRYFTGAWYETKTISGATLSAGEIQLRLFEDKSCSAVREFNNQPFDYARGTWSANKKGVVTFNLIGDLADEVFRGTVKKGAFGGSFSGGGHVGKFAVSELPLAQDPDR